MPADRNHRFGHGKAEALVALFQVVLIIVASIGIALRAIERIGSGATTANAEYGIGVSLIAIAATFALLAYQRHVIRQTASVAIGPDHLHYQSDLLLHLSFLIALALAQYFGFSVPPPLFGIGLSFFSACTPLPPSRPPA